MAIPAAERESLGQCLVLVGERGRALLVGQVEIAVDLVPDAHRHPQERGHRRVARRKPVATRMLFDVIEA